MGEINLLAKKGKRTTHFVTNYKKIQPRYRNEIWHRKMCCADKEMWGKKNNERNRTAKSGKNQNTRSKGKLQVLRNIKNKHYQTSRDYGKKIRKGYFKQTRKLFEIKLCDRNLIKGINTWTLLL